VSITRLGASTTPASARSAQPATGGQRAGARISGGQSERRDNASSGQTTDQLQALSDALNVDPEELLAHLTGATATAAGAAESGENSATSPAATFLSALRNPDHPANAWASGLMQFRGGLLVDVIA